MTRELSFALSNDDPDWLPVGVEGMPTEGLDEGFRILVPPFFVKNLSVRDIIRPNIDAVNGLVFDWKHIEKSKRSTIWLFASDCEKWQSKKRSILAMACNIETFEQFKLHAVDLPSEVPLAKLDSTLSVLEPDETFAVAYPSLRHPAE